VTTVVFDANSLTTAIALLLVAILLYQKINKD